jgi:hypothetical protein
MELVQRIHLNLALTRVALAGAIARLLSRGESIEHIEAVAEAVCESGKAFERETERQLSTQWQRTCGKGRWIQWVCPCVLLCRWTGIPQRLHLFYADWIRDPCHSGLHQLQGDGSLIRRVLCCLVASPFRQGLHRLGFLHDATERLL